MRFKSTYLVSQKVKFLVIEIDKKTKEERAISTRRTWQHALDEVSEIRRRRPVRMNLRFAHEIQLIRGGEQ